MGERNSDKVSTLIWMTLSEAIFLIYLWFEFLMNLFGYECVIFYQIKVIYIGNQLYAYFFVRNCKRESFCSFV